MKMGARDDLPMPLRFPADCAVKIGVDLTRFDGSYSGGVTTFALGLTRGLIRSATHSDRIVLLATKSNRDNLLQRFGSDSVSIIEVDDRGRHRYPIAFLGYLGFACNVFKLPYWYQRAFNARFARKVEDAIDVLIAPMTTLSFLPRSAPSILSVHDIQHEYHPDNFSFRERAARWGSYRLSCWAASAVQASSQFVKDCLLEKFEFLPADKIFLAPEGVDFEAFDPEAPMEAAPTGANIEPGTFLFYPAQLWPHKNHLLLIEALIAFRDRNGYEMPCLLTGQDCGMLESIMVAIDQSGLTKVRYLGKVPFTQLLWLYANCRAVLALGLHESSSLPLREGAVFGKPLICSDIPPNRELESDLFILPFACRSAADLSVKFDALISSGAGLVEKSMQNKVRVRRFSWDEIARQYIAVARNLCRATPEASPSGSA
jgi:glycosyltransferase involved in cell wall biosynthesis